MAYSTRKKAKEAGWFSRRHRTDEAHRASVAKRNAFRGRWARKQNADTRAAIWNSLTAEQQSAKAARERDRFDASR